MWFIGSRFCVRQRLGLSVWKWSSKKDVLQDHRVCVTSGYSISQIFDTSWPGLKLSQNQGHRNHRAVEDKSNNHYILKCSNCLAVLWQMSITNKKIIIMAKHRINNRNIYIYTFVGSQIMTEIVSLTLWLSCPVEWIWLSEWTVLRFREDGVWKFILNQ